MTNTLKHHRVTLEIALVASFPVTAANAEEASVKAQWAWRDFIRSSGYHVEDTIHRSTVKEINPWPKP